VTITSNVSLYAMGPLSGVSCCLSCLPVMLVYCGRMVGWIRIPVGTEVGFEPGDIVLDGSWGPSFAV